MLESVFYFTKPYLSSPLCLIPFSTIAKLTICCMLGIASVPDLVAAEVLLKLFFLLELVNDMFE